MQIEMLGYTYDSNLRLQPAPAKIEGFKKKIRKIFNCWKQVQDLENLLSEVNSVTRGWSNYYRLSRADKPFQEIDCWLIRYILSAVLHKIPDADQRFAFLRKIAKNRSKAKHLKLLTSSSKIRINALPYRFLRSLVNPETLVLTWNTVMQHR